jgi:hypothetical protein
MQTNKQTKNQVNKNEDNGGNKEQIMCDKQKINSKMTKVSPSLLAVD